MSTTLSRTSIRRSTPPAEPESFEDVHACPDRRRTERPSPFHQDATRDASVTTTAGRLDRRRTDQQHAGRGPDVDRAPGAGTARAGFRKSPRQAAVLRDAVGGALGLGPRLRAPTLPKRRRDARRKARQHHRDRDRTKGGQTDGRAVLAELRRDRRLGRREHLLGYLFPASPCTRSSTTPTASGAGPCETSASASSPRPGPPSTS